MGDYASIDSRENKNKFVRGNFRDTPPYIHTSIRLNPERSVMERYPVRPFLRWSQVLLGVLLVVQMAIAQTPETNVSAKSEAPWPRTRTQIFWLPPSSRATQTHQERVEL